MKPYPLQFQPEFKERVWGGRNLERFGFQMQEGRIGEAWTIGDHPNGTTKVMNGELKGVGLDEVRERYGKEFFGAKGFSEKTGRFPLLIKLLDCEDDLSVQVHPNDDYAGLPAGELGKTEMWYVLDAKPGAKIIYGLKDGVTRENLAAAIRENRIMDSLHEVPVAAGDTFYIPAGTVHALCSGVLVAEIQQNSDTTYRLHDYNRLGLDGSLRELHVEDSLNVIAYEDSGATRMTTELTAVNSWLNIARSPYFLVEKGKTEDSWSLGASTDSFIIHIICEGTGTLRWDDGELAAKPGDCFLIPAGLGSYSFEGKLTMLRSLIP
jgi:mannose-6-phosphate isomerase